MPTGETDDQIKALETQIRTLSRVEALESQIRTLRRVVYSMCGLFVAGILVLVMVISNRGIPDVIKAKNFEVVTSEGKSLVQMGSSYFDGTETGAIHTFNEDGQNLVILDATTDGRGVISTFNEDGQSLVALGVTTNGKGFVGTFNGKGQEIVRLGTSTDGQGIVTTFNEDGQEIVRLGVSTTGEGMVITFNGEGRELWQSPSR